MAYNGAVFAGTLIDINVAAAGSLTILNPLLAQIDFTLFGSLGLGSLQANLSAQLSAALQASLDLGLGISNPFVGFAAALAGIAVLQATITLALSGAIPAISLEIGVQLSALASFAALLGVQIGGLEALIQAGIAVKLPAVTFAGALAGALSAGPIFVISWENIPMSVAGSAINADFSTGLTLGPNTILPGEAVYGVLLVTKAPSAWAGIQATMLV
jgi:hypothetical protein